MSKGWLFIFLLLTCTPRGHAQISEPLFTSKPDLLSDTIRGSEAVFPDSALVKRHLKNQVKTATDSATSLISPIAPIQIDVSRINNARNLDSAQIRGFSEPYLDKLKQKVVDRKEIQVLQSEKIDIKPPFSNSLSSDSLSMSGKEVTGKMLRLGKEFASAYSDEIGQAQEKLTHLKQKYVALASSEDPASGVRRYSLKGEPFLKRLVVGGNFSFAKTSPMALKFSPVLGYKLTRKLETGIMGTYRWEDGVSQNQLGYGAFASYLFWKNFFAYAESERLKTKQVESMPSWSQSNVLALGTRLHLSGFLEIGLITGYNFSHKNSNYIYDTPLIVKTYFRFY